MGPLACMIASIDAVMTSLNSNLSVPQERNQRQHFPYMCSLLEVCWLTSLHCKNYKEPSID